MVLNNILPPKPFQNVLYVRRLRKTLDSLLINSYLSDKLSSTPKLSHGKYPGFKLWSECLKGNVDAWEEMKEYKLG